MPCNGTFWPGCARLFNVTVTLPFGNTMNLDQQQQAILGAGVVVSTIVSTTLFAAEDCADPMPYHTLALTGEVWVLELLNGHPDRIRCELGVRFPVFNALVMTLREIGHGNSRKVSIEEQLAIFWYTSVTGLSTQHVGKHFQRSSDTITQ